MSDLIKAEPVFEQEGVYTSPLRYTRKDERFKANFSHIYDVFLTQMSSPDFAIYLAELQTRVDILEDRITRLENELPMLKLGYKDE